MGSWPQLVVAMTQKTSVKSYVSWAAGVISSHLQLWKTVRFFSSLKWRLRTLMTSLQFNHSFWLLKWVGRCEGPHALSHGWFSLWNLLSFQISWSIFTGRGKTIGVEVRYFDLPLDQILWVAPSGTKWHQVAPSGIIKFFKCCRPVHCHVHWSWNACAVEPPRTNSRP